MKAAQLYPTLCNPMDYRVHGILQARILEWVAFPFSRASKHQANKMALLLLSARQFLQQKSGGASLPGMTSIFVVVHSVVSSSLQPHGLQHTIEELDVVLSRKATYKMETPVKIILLGILESNQKL